MTREVVLVAGCRTAQGKFGGALRDIPAHQLAIAAILDVIKRAGVDAGAVNTVIAGQVYQSSEALNIGRFCALDAGLPFTITGAGVNVACCSSLEAVNSAARDIACGNSDVAIAAGVESMSTAPFRVVGHRWGTRRGNSEIIDQFDESTWSASTYRYGRFSMGMAADHVAKVYGLSRTEQDEYALRSHALAVQSIDKGLFAEEIVPFAVKQRKGDVVFAQDELPRRDTSLASLAKLSPVFVEDGGTVTAGNSSGVSDGAAAVLLMSRDKAAELGLEPIAKIRSTARVGVDPRLICMKSGSGRKGRRGARRSQGRRRRMVGDQRGVLVGRAVVLQGARHRSRTGQPERGRHRDGASGRLQRRAHGRHDDACDAPHWHEIRRRDHRRRRGDRHRHGDRAVRVVRDPRFSRGEANDHARATYR